MKRLLILLILMIGYLEGQQNPAIPFNPPTYSGTALPTFCNNGSLFYNVGTYLWYVCGPANSWNLLSGTGGGAPTGPAGGVLNGTYPNPGCVPATNTTNGCVRPDGTTVTINNGVISSSSSFSGGTTNVVQKATSPTTLGDSSIKDVAGVITTGAVVNGVSYSSRYIGATLDVRANACISDAENLANGNTSGICNSTGESGAQTIAAQISVGTSGNLPVTWILPSQCAWNSTINNGTLSAIYQYPGTTITGNAGVYGCVISQSVASSSGSTGVYALYNNYGVSGGAGYYRANHISFETSVKTASGWAFYVNGAYDNSSWSDIEVADTSAGDSAGIRLGGGSILCCSTEFRNLTSNSQYTGPIPLDIEGINGSAYTTSLKIIGGSFAHPKAGQPNIKINDSEHNMSLDFSGAIYLEGNNTDTTTTPIQISGAAAVHFSQVVYSPQTTGMTAAVVSVASSTSINTTLGIDSFSSNGQLDNHTVVSDGSGWCNATPCLTSSDASGDLTYYSNAPIHSISASLASPVSVLTYGALGNEQLSANCAITGSSTTLVCTGGTFASGDVGKSISVRGAGATAPATNGSSAASSGGSLPCATTIYFKITYVNAYGQSTPSTEGSQATPACGSAVDTVTINSPAAGQSATSWRLYAATISGHETLVSNAGCASTVGNGCAIGTAWTISAGYNSSLGSLAFNTTNLMAGQPPPTNSGFITTISAYTSATTVTLAVAAEQTVSGTQATWGTDDSAAIQATINAVANAGGGSIIFPATGHAYLILSQLTFPVYNTYYQNPVKLSGTVPNWTEADQLGPTIPITSGSVLDLKADAALGKIQTLGYGWLGIDHLVIGDWGDDNAIFIYDTNTQIDVQENFFSGVSVSASYSHTSEPGAVNDAIVLGGTYTGTPTLNVNSTFNGNGSYFAYNRMMGIHRGFVLNYWVNGSLFTNNLLYPGCGNSFGGMIEIYGAANSFGPINDTFQSNNFEFYGSKYLYYVLNANLNNFTGDVAFDYNAQSDYIVFDGISNGNLITNLGYNSSVVGMLELGSAVGQNSFIDPAGGQALWQQQQQWSFNGNGDVFRFKNTAAQGGQYGAQTLTLIGPSTTSGYVTSLGFMPTDKFTSPTTGVKAAASIQIPFTSNGSTVQFWTTNSYSFGLNSTPFLYGDYNNRTYLGGGLISLGTTFTTSGCGTAGSVTGGAESGTFTVGTGASPCTFVMTINGATGQTAPNGWNCWGVDQTSGIALIQSASSATTCSLKGNAATSDVIRWGVLRGY